MPQGLIRRKSEVELLGIQVKNNSGKGNGTNYTNMIMSANSVVDDKCCITIIPVEVGFATIIQDDQKSSSSSYQLTNKHILLQVQKKKEPSQELR